MSEFSALDAAGTGRLGELEQAILERISKEWDAGYTVHVRSDFDGSLSDFTDYPAESMPLPHAVDALQRLADVPRVTAGIVTGRSLEFASQVFPDVRIELDCSYGAESRHSGVNWQAPWIMDGQKQLGALRASLIAEIRANGANVSTSARQAAANGLVYVESQPTKIAFHVRGGSKTNPQLPDQLAAAVLRLHSDFGLGSRTHALNIEFDLRTPDGAEVNKSAVFARLLDVDGGHTNFVIYTGDDAGDVKAAQLVHEYGGVFMVVRHSETPEELVEIADYVFDSPSEHVTFLDSLSHSIASSA